MKLFIFYPQDSFFSDILKVMLVFTAYLMNFSEGKFVILKYSMRKLGTRQYALKA